jgi:hypothetical protein
MVYAVVLRPYRFLSFSALPQNFIWIEQPSRLGTQITMYRPVTPGFSAL